MTTDAGISDPNDGRILWRARDERLEGHVSSENGVSRRGRVGDLHGNRQETLSYRCDLQIAADRPDLQRGCGNGGSIEGEAGAIYGLVLDTGGDLDIAGEGRDL